METRPEIGAALTAIRGRQPGYAKAREYIAGTQRDVYDKRDWEREMGKRVPQPRDNITRTIVETLVSRLQPRDFVPAFAKATGAQRAADTANAIFTRNRMDEQLPEVFRTAAICGDAYLLVHEERGRAVITRQKPEQCHVEYDPEFPGRVLWGAKWWVDGKRVRLNLYMPDALYRYVTNTEAWGADNTPTLGRSFGPYEEDGRPAVQPNPTGIVPIFHFPNGAPTGEYGVSELDGLYPLLDHINSGLCDLVLAMRSVGIPWRFVSGAKDETQDQYSPALGASLTPVLGEETPEEPVGEGALLDPSNYLDDDGVSGGPGKLIMLENDAARPWQLNEATLDGPIKFLDTLRAAIARNSRRPMHSLGLAEKVATATEILVADNVFLAEVGARKTTYGNRLEDLAAYCVLIETSHSATGYVGGGDLPTLSLNWEPSEITIAPSETELLQAAIDAGMPFEDLLVRFFGYAADDAAEIAARKQVGDEVATEAAASRFAAGLVG